MRLIAHFVAAIVLLGFLVSYAVAEQQLSRDRRESVLDRRAFIEKDLVLHIPKESRLCDDMEMWKRHVHIGDCSLYCEQEGQGPTMVLLHGGPGATHHEFHPHFSRATDFLNVVYYDQRGCGLSQFWDGDGYTIKQAVDDLEKLREALGIGKWFVLGHSYGGTLAQSYTARYPGHVAGLVLVGSACHGLSIDIGSTRQYDFISEEEKQRIRQIHRSGNLTIEQSVFNAHLNGDWKRQSFYRPRRQDLARLALYEWKHDEGFREAIHQSLGTLDLTGVFENCPIPILIMEGKWDLTWGKNKSERLQACFPESRLIVFDDAGHSPFADEPKEFFAALEGFVKTVQNISDREISDWKERLADLDAERMKPASPGDNSHTVIFKTGELAPSDFASWTFYWTGPGIDRDANLQMIVLQPDGQEYTRHALTLGKGNRVRSDFGKGLPGGDPSVFYKQHVAVKFTADKGQIRFPGNAQFHFEFHNRVDAKKQ